MTDNLKQQTAKGLFWGGISNLVMQGLNLILGIILARKLMPADYGMVGLLLIFSNVAGAIQESGFTAALVNKKTINHDDYNAVFWFNVLIGVCLYVLLFFCAPLIAQFFHLPSLTDLARFSFLSIVLSSLGVAHNAMLIKRLRVKQNVMVQMTSLVLSGAIGVFMAYRGMAYWGLATQTLTYVAGVMIGRWIFSGWHPTFSINFRPLRSMLAFSLKMLASNLVTQLNNNILTIILGRCYNEREVGHFNQANKWSYMGSYSLQAMVNGVAQPVLKEVEGDPSRQQRIFRKMLRFTAFVSMPCMFGLSLVAPELIVIAITEKWAASAALLQVICIGSAFLPVQNLMYNLIVSKGRSDLCLWLTIAYGVVQTVVGIVCSRYGIPTMVWAYAIVNVVWVWVWGVFVKREMQLRFVQLLYDVLPFSVIAAAAMLLAAAVASLADGLWLVLAIKVAVMAAFYLLCLYLLKAKVLNECFDQLRLMIRKKKQTTAG